MIGLDPKTVRRHITVAEKVGLARGQDVSEPEVTAVLIALPPSGQGRVFRLPYLV